MAISWTAVESALAAFVRNALSLSTGQVVWSHQNGPRPTGDFVTLTLDGPTALGVDSMEYNTDLGQANGSEVEQLSTGIREFRLSFQAFCASSVGDANARALLSKLQMALARDTLNEALDAAGVDCFDAGRVQNVPQVLDDGFESRALLDTGWYVADSVSERTGYIDTVQLTDYTGNSTIDI